MKETRYSKRNQPLELRFKGSNGPADEAIDQLIHLAGGIRRPAIVREIIHSALQKFAASIICVHNHPSANITPSTQDKTFTKELCDAGKLMEIKVLDHVIVGDNQYYSFADEGLMG